MYLSLIHIYDANTQEQEEEKELPSTVTVLVRPEQSRLLARLEAEGEKMCIRDRDTVAKHHGMQAPEGQPMEMAGM